MTTIVIPNKHQLVGCSEALISRLSASDYLILSKAPACTEKQDTCPLTANLLQSYTYFAVGSRHKMPKTSRLGCHNMLFFYHGELPSVVQDLNCHTSSVDKFSDKSKKRLDCVKLLT